VKRTGLGLVFCCLGCGLLFGQWASVSVLYVDPTPLPDGTYKGKGLPVTEVVPGYRLWHAVAAASLFIAIAVFLLITGPIHPDPWWRPAAVLIAAAAVVGVVLAGMSYPYAALDGDPSHGRLVAGTAWGWANYSTLGTAAGLLLVAALECRSWVAGRFGGVRPSSPSSRGNA
jgi:hypothetical protein